MMEETTITDESYDYDSFDEQTYERPTERWAPLGASSVSPQPMGQESLKTTDQQLHDLEVEQEQLNSSLLSLTSHFAQVQFRLKQIVSASSEDREALLKDLEEFAFKGIPDIQSFKTDEEPKDEEQMSKEKHQDKITQQREKQQQLILQLKSQLADLEKYAYETGQAEGLPTDLQIEKQSVIIDEMKTKLGLELGDLSKLSTDDLKQVVDSAICQIVNPSKVKEKLVNQLRTQVSDLERFIQFLQGEADTPGPLGSTRCTCSCPVHPQPEGASSEVSSESSSCAQECCIPEHRTMNRIRGQGYTKPDKNFENLSMMKRVLTVLQIYFISQFGCGTQEFRKNVLKRTSQGNHYGDIRANLEVAVEKVLEVSREPEPPADKLLYNNSDDEENVLESHYNEVLTHAVRKDLAMSIKELLQHGLMEVGQSSSLVPFVGCFTDRSKGPTKMMHAWDLVLKYYEMKHGQNYNKSPVRTLSQSFDLDIIGSKAVTAKQTLLSCVGSVIASHGPLKRSEDSHFKALICMALNERKLITWLRLILKTTSLIDFYYQPWSYVVKTKFEDTFQALEKLNMINFILPVDLAVRQFTSIKDAF